MNVNPEFNAWPAGNSYAGNTQVVERQGILHVNSLLISEISAILDASIWQEFQATAAKVLDSSKSDTPVRSFYNRTWKPAETQEEFDARYFKRHRLRSKELSFQFPDDPALNYPEAFYLKAGVIDPLALSKLETAAELDPSLTFELIDTGDRKALLTAIAHVQKHINLLCGNWAGSPSTLQENIWRTLFADQWPYDENGYFRPCPYVCNAILCF